MCGRTMTFNQEVLTLDSPDSLPAPLEKIRDNIDHAPRLVVLTWDSYWIRKGFKEQQYRQKDVCLCVRMQVPTSGNVVMADKKLINITQFTLK